MLKDSYRTINLKLSYELWKKLKLVSVNEDITIQEVVTNILINAVNKKTVDVPDVPKV